MGDVEIPGSPGGLDALAGQLHAAAGDIGAVTNRVASNGLEGAWSGQAADAFRSSLHQLPGELGKVGTAFTDAAGAITQFAAKLAELQEKARWYNEHVANVEQELRDANARNEQAQTTLDKARLEHSLATDPVSLSTASRAVSLGESLVRQAASDMEDAEGSLAQLISGGNGVRGEYESAVRVCCAALDAARDGGGSLLSGWRRDFDRMAGGAAHLGGTLWHAGDGALHDAGRGLDEVGHLGIAAFDYEWAGARRLLVDVTEALSNVTLIVGVGAAIVGTALVVGSVLTFQPEGLAAGLVLEGVADESLAASTEISQAGYGVATAGDLVAESTSQTTAEKKEYATVLPQDATSFAIAWLPGGSDDDPVFEKAGRAVLNWGIGNDAARGVNSVEELQSHHALIAPPLASPAVFHFPVPAADELA